MTSSFQPTHQLVSRTRKVPVIVITHGDRSQVLTEQEWREGREPAFELHPKLGLFCKGVQIVGYHLEPLTAPVEVSSPASTY
ncbi:MAG TPA: hypothetical protein V6D06_04410 [Trichocoleus sp.]